MLGDGFVLTVDPDERAVERVSQNLQADAELAGAGPAAVLTAAINNAVEGYGPCPSASSTRRSSEAAEAVFSDGRSRAAIRLYHLARQVLEFRRAAAPMAEMLDRLATEGCQRRPATGSDGTFASSTAHLKHPG